MQLYSKNEKIKNLERKVRELEVDKETYTDFLDDMKEQKNNLERENSRLRDENSRLRDENFRLNRLNEMLTQAICGVWREGTFIVYDERKPRNICVIKDGKCIDANKATQVSFNWYKNEFPSLEVTTE